MRGRGRDGDRQDHPPAQRQRARAALQRRHPWGNGDRRRTVDPGAPAPRAGRHRRLRRPEPAGQLRHRTRRGRAGLHHGEPGRARRRHAPTGGGHGGPARSARPARPLAARPLGRPATAGGHRRRADGLPAGAGAGRAHVRARPGRGRRGPQRVGPSGPRPRPDRAHGRAPARARAPFRRSHGARAGRGGTARGRPARRHHAHGHGGAPTGGAGPPRRMGSTAAHRARRAAPGGRPARADRAVEPRPGPRRGAGRGRSGGVAATGRRPLRAGGRTRVGRPRGPSGRGHRVDGAQRLGQVVVAEHPLGWPRPDPRLGQRRWR